MTSLKAPPRTGGGSVMREPLVLLQEFCRGVKRDIAHNTNFKGDEPFSTWNWKFVATARMYHSHLVLDPKYVPQDDVG
jgi:hypothetical protein